MRDFSQPKEFEEELINTEELFYANGLRITYSNYLFKTYVLKTDLYYIVVTEKYSGNSSSGHGKYSKFWNVSIMESNNKHFTSSLDELPEFMQVFCENSIRKFTCAEEVDYLVKKLLKLKVFL